MVYFSPPIPCSHFAKTPILFIVYPLYASCAKYEKKPIPQPLIHHHHCPPAFFVITLYILQPLYKEIEAVHFEG